MAIKPSDKARTSLKKRRKVAGKSVGILSKELASTPVPHPMAALKDAVEGDGGSVLSSYREPFAGHWLMLAALPIDQVEPTPYQRKLSDAHVRKLETVIAKLGCFLDPIIVVRKESVHSRARYWTPNGNHRLSAMRTLGAKSIVGIVVPEASAAYKILALNTEKAHNLRERALEVVKMYQELAALVDVTEETYALEFEEAALVTLGLCYLERPRFSGGAYHPILKRADQFLKKPLLAALQIRQRQSKVVLALDDLVTAKVEALKARGLTSPYLKNFVVARINPLRFRPKEAEPLSVDELLDRMASGAARFSPDRIKMEDLAHSGGAPDE
jgi:ParB family chromosome partitioning protein